MICKVLREEAKTKYKFEKAKTYILYKFVELRSEKSALP